MPKTKYHVHLTHDQRNTLIDLISNGTTSPKCLMHANVLLSADENSTNRMLNRKIFDRRISTITSTRAAFLEWELAHSDDNYELQL